MPEGRDRVAVFGASGHTGRFVVSELRRRGLTPIPVGRDATRLKALGDLDLRVASVDERASLDRALSGAGAVINCAGPFLDTATPVIEAALRARVHYLDVTAEQPAAQAAFERFANAARDAQIVIAPAMAFYGGLGDLLATAAMGDWAGADEIHVAVALDSWKPTLGTRLTGRRNTARRLVVSGGELEFLADPPPTRTWSFPPPFGTQAVRALPFSEIITISRHLRAREIHSYMNKKPIEDIVDPDTPPPTAADERGRSDQIFVMDVLVRRGSEERRASAQGRDIYAVTAPLVVEAAQRVLDGRVASVGAVSAGEIFAAREFLDALSPDHLTFEIR